MTERLHVRAQGHVQGVGFRYFINENAQRLGINGWVRNCWDGSIEVSAEASREKLEQLLGLIRRGPRGSQVSDLHFEWYEAGDEFQNFRIRRTE